MSVKWSAFGPALYSVKILNTAPLNTVSIVSTLIILHKLHQASTQ